MTFGLVEAGEIIGILFCWQIGAASSDLDEATSPRTATALSCEIEFANDGRRLAGLGLVVFGDQLELFPEDSSRGVDLVDRQSGSLVRRLAEARTAAGKRGVFANHNLSWAKIAEPAAIKARQTVGKMQRSMGFS